MEELDFLGASRRQQAQSLSPLPGYGPPDLGQQGRLSPVVVIQNGNNSRFQAAQQQLEQRGRREQLVLT